MRVESDSALVMDIKLRSIHKVVKMMKHMKSSDPRYIDIRYFCLHNQFSPAVYARSACVM